MYSFVWLIGVKNTRKKFFDSTAITTSLYCPAHPKYHAETILPPTPYSESVQSMHQDRCRCIQVHTLRLCPPFPVRACAFGLYLILLYLYYNMFFYIVKYIQRTPRYCYLRALRFFPKNLSYSNPQDRSRTDLGSRPSYSHTLAVFSRLLSEVISLIKPLTANRQHEEEVKRIIKPSLIFSFILSYERTKVKKKITVVNQDCHRSVCIGFVSENLCVKLLPPFLRLPFVFFEVTGAY